MRMYFVDSIVNAKINEPQICLHSGACPTFVLLVMQNKMQIVIFCMVERTASLPEGSNSQVGNFTFVNLLDLAGICEKTRSNKETNHRGAAKSRAYGFSLRLLQVSAQSSELITLTKLKLPP